MHISSNNEWDSFKSVIVGSATNANWPVNCRDFRKIQYTTTWIETPLPSGPVPQHIIDSANEDLNNLADFLISVGVKVYRPTDLDFVKHDGFYNYCPRDRLLIIGETIIDASMAYKCRQMEREAYKFLECEFVKAEGRWDAANICKLNNDLLYLVSETGDRAGADWLQAYLGNQYRVHIVNNLYSGVHIDSTIVPVREGLVVLNGNRVNSDNIPAVLKSWDKIWMYEFIEQPFYEFPYASNAIGMNFLVVDSNSVICDPKQIELRRQLDKHHVDSHGIDLRHSRTLGGGHHCVTLDLIRQ